MEPQINSGNKVSLFKKDLKTTNIDKQMEPQINSGNKMSLISNNLKTTEIDKQMEPQINSGNKMSLINNNLKTTEIDKKIEPQINAGNKMSLLKKYLKGIDKPIEPQKHLGYNSKVKISNWNRYLEAEPKDNDPYNPAGGNYFISTYNRWGTSQEMIPISTTHAMLRQIENKEKEFTSRRATINYVSYHNTEAPSLQKYQLKTGLTSFPKDSGITNYISTNQYEYRHPSIPVVSYNMKKKTKVYFGRKSHAEETKLFCEKKYFDDVDASSVLKNSRPLVPPYEITL